MGTNNRFNAFSADISNGEKVAEELNIFGLSVVFIDTIESPSAYIHNYAVTNPRDILKLEQVKKVFSIRYKTPVNYSEAQGENALSADFCLIMDKLSATSIYWNDYESEIKKPFDFLVGIDAGNKPIVLNLDSLPHLLIAGESGGGKSVTLNTIIQSLTHLKEITPEKLSFVMIDTKQTELTQYEKSKFLYSSVCTTFQDAFYALKGVNSILTERYTEMRLKGQKQGDFCRFVVVIDELADLMMSGRKKAIEPLIVRIAQMGRACNIHLILATQRPTVDVCTGHIKANIPTRLALQVASSRDSVNILDKKGAEDLRGKGDALLKIATENKIKRLQCFNYKK